MKKLTLTMLSLVAAIVANAATPMLGTNVATVERMYQFVKSKNSSFDREIAEQFIAVSTIYGMRGDIALCQSIIETGWFKYTGGTAVTPDDHNYCGLGVTTLGQKGCQFSTVKEGVTAQIQHLYAYCCTKSIPAGETLVDPRFNYVTRGCAPNWEDLGSGKWAAAAGYGTAIIAMYNDMMAFNVQGDTPSTGNASLTASTTSVSLSGTQGGTAPSTSVTITGANLTSDIAYSSSSSAFTVSTSNWNSRTGGTLKITLNTALTAGTYSGYIAVQSGTTRIQINCTGTISTGTTPSPGTASLKASTTSLSFTAAKGATAPSSSVTITGANLTSDIAYNSSSSAFKVSTSNWNSRTGGTLNISLDTSKSVGTYSGYIAVQSGDQRVEINCTGTITEATQPEQPTPGTPSLKASSTSVSFTAEKGATAPSKTITITGANLTSDIAYNSSSSAFKVSTSNWNSRTGGSMTITLDTSKSAGNYSGYVAVQSGSTRIEINCSATITEASQPETPETTIAKLPSQFSTDWSYSAVGGNSVTWMNPANDYTRNMTLKGDNLYVVQRDPDNGTGYIRIVNANTGAMKGSLSSTGITKDVYQFASVANMGGTIVACNLAYGATSALKVYSWSSDSATPSLVLETTNHGARSGDLMSASGTINNGKLYFTSNTGYEGKVYVYTVTNGVANPTPTEITLKDSKGAAFNYGGSFAVIEIRANEDGTFWATGKNGAPALFNANGTLIRELNPTALDGNIYGTSYCPISYGKFNLAAAVAYKTTVQQGYLNLIDVTNGEASASKLNSYPVLGSSGVSNGTFVSTALAKVEGSTIHLWTLIPKQGVAKYTAKGETSGVESMVSDNAKIVVCDNEIKVVGEEVESISIYSLTGVEVVHGNCNELATDNLAHGIYVVLAKTTTGKVVSDKVYIK
ncbi:MAG: glucosaminidase domain-containing protein [Muribaculaceae bacterium]|nr:glucosaminidase domain-containing protein [Muribaculaceae bacterium]